MFPVLVYVYVRLARNEEREVAGEFGEQRDAYAASTPAFFPRHRNVRKHAAGRARPGRASPPTAQTRPEVTDVNAADVLTWLLLALQILTTAASGVLLARRGKRDASRLDRSIRRTAPALLIAGMLPLSALLTTDAPAGAWLLWGAGCIVAALVHAFADTLRDTRAVQSAATAGRMP